MHTALRAPLRAARPVPGRLLFIRTIAALPRPAGEPFDDENEDSYWRLQVGGHGWVGWRGRLLRLRRGGRRPPPALQRRALPSSALACRTQAAPCWSPLLPWAACIGSAGKGAGQPPHTVCPCSSAPTPTPNAGFCARRSGEGAGPAHPEATHQGVHQPAVQRSVSGVGNGATSHAARRRRCGGAPLVRRRASGLASRCGEGAAAAGTACRERAAAAAAAVLASVQRS